MLTGLAVTTTLVASFAATAARADYWGDRAIARDAINGFFGVAREAAAADREARSKRCWQEERRVKQGGATVIRRVDVCE